MHATLVLLFILDVQLLATARDDERGTLQQTNNVLLQWVLVRAVWSGYRQADGNSAAENECRCRCRCEADTTITIQFLRASAALQQATDDRQVWLVDGCTRRDRLYATHSITVCLSPSFICTFSSSFIINCYLIYHPTIAPYAFCSGFFSCCCL